jgi:cystathionine gamma-synthase
MTNPDDTPRYGSGTRTVHGDPDRRKPHPWHTLTQPITRTATYTFDDSADLRTFMRNRAAGDKQGREQYGRYSNPTVSATEARLAVLEGGEAALLTASGMAAVTHTVLALVGTGDHLIITDDAYSKTRQFTAEFLPRIGVAVTEVPMGDYAALEGAIRPETRVILSESPTNPYLRVADLARIGALGRQHDIRTIIDATFATPINQRPLEFGIDYVVHSATKYLGGHNDLLAGVVIGRKSAIQPVRDLVGMLGPICDADVAALVLRGVKTLALRVRHQNGSALAIARFLADHPAVVRVWYPGLPDHPDHAIAQAQMSGFGGVVSFEVDPARAESAELAAAQVIDALTIPYNAPSLGGCESLVMQPAIVSYFDLTPAERAAIGMKDNLIRLAVGIEDSADLIADLRQALEKRVGSRE